MFVPRALFGAYLEERLEAALVTGDGPGLSLIRGEAVRILARPDRTIRLSDGREIPVDAVVLATGNLAPRAPGGPDQWFYDSPGFVPDPWAPDAFDGLSPDDPLLLLGTGLTTVDIVLKLTAAGHRGPILATRGAACCRRCMRAAAHGRRSSRLPCLASPRRLMRLIREQVTAAEAHGIPWQRVFDAARPAIPAVWEQLVDAREAPVPPASPHPLGRVIATAWRSASMMRSTPKPGTVGWRSCRRGCAAIIWQETRSR